ncbi:MAG: LptF/LptG family permease [Spirochaetia bacterium]|nr:LptF/LptG family permease [Spirochaetia bacterium]
MEILRFYFKPTILTRHLLKSFLGPFIIGELFFSFVILLFNMRVAIQAILEKNVDIILLVKLSLFSMGWTLGMTVPMSALLAIIMTIGALNADQEIIVMRASGIHYFRIFRPYLMFGALIASGMLWYQMNAVPYCMRMVNVVISKIANYNPTALIEPGQFTLLDENALMSRNIYVESISIDAENQKMILKGIQIRKVERINGINIMTELVYAKKGEKVIKVLSNKEQVKALRLYDGFVFVDNEKKGSFEKLDFSKNGFMDINMRDNFTHMESNSNKSIIEVGMGELLQLINKLEKSGNTQDTYFKKLKVELYKRTSLPFATIIFIISGFPLGIVNRRSGKGVGFGQAIIIIFIYFSFFLSADALATQKTFMTPFVAAWFGNILLFLFGIILYTIKTTDLMWKIKLNKKEY